jgi:SAM-dependent methyltransferase
MADKFYAEIFNHNGTSYHKAMQLAPNARDDEFNAILSLLSLQSGDRLLDVPAGGGYLKNYLSPSIKYQGLDFSDGFAPNSEIASCSETAIPIESNSIEKVVCLAAMHHVENKAGFISELHRCLVPGGALLIADVTQGSKEALFLNGFVNQWNSLGHNGDFISPPRDLALLQNSGFTAHNITKSFRWNFIDEPTCHEYLRLLFALDKQPLTSLLKSAIDKLGTQKSSSGFHLNWALGCLIATKL